MKLNFENIKLKTEVAEKVATRLKLDLSNLDADSTAMLENTILLCQELQKELNSAKSSIKINIGDHDRG